MFARTVTLSLCLASTLVCALTTARAPAEESKDTWVQITSPNFIVASNAGEREARHVAQEFEQIRGVFHAAFPKLRLDPGKPIIILAAKNENTMKLLLPDFWEQKNHVHPAGLYQSGEEKHYVAVRTDTQGENRYHIVYHEYTHALLHLNFTGLPLWLDEGLAEFYGNTGILGNDIQLGKIDEYHLTLLRQSKLIPIDQLLQVDHRSPYYNEQNRASIFYAESWALVHYLLLDPEPRKRDLLAHFLQAWDKTGNQVEAAQQAFGDLKKFGQVVEAYARQGSFYVGNIKSTIQTDEKSYASRILSAAEATTMRGDFYANTQRPKEAREALEAGVKLDEKLAVAHGNLGAFYYRQGETTDAARELQRAIDLDSKGFETWFLAATLGLRKPDGLPDSFPDPLTSVEKSIALNPNFAPAASLQANLYSMDPGKEKQALAAAQRAVKLEPGTFVYVLNYGLILINTGHLEDARILSGRLTTAAKSPTEVFMARSLEERVESSSKFSAEHHSAGAESISTDEVREARDNSHFSTSQNSSKPTASGSLNTASDGNAASSAKNATVDYHTVQSEILATDCSVSPGAVLMLSSPAKTLNLHVTSIAKLSESEGDKSGASKIPECEKWKSRRVKATYIDTPTGEFDGEVVSIQFF